LATLEHKHIVKSVDFDEAATRLATAGADKQLRIHALGSGGAPTLQQTVAHSDKLRKVAFTGPHALVTATEDGTVRLWDTRTLGSGADAKPQRETMTCAGLSDLEVSRCGRFLTGAAGQTVFVLESDTLAPAAGFLGASNTSGSLSLPFLVESASLHPSGGCIIAGGSDVTVHQLDAHTGAESAQHRGHHGSVHTVRFAPDGRTFSSGADDATIRLWKYE
jgi:serine-threonine kinase receptor-associated protein